jgi:hypothetical protein
VQARKNRRLDGLRGAPDVDLAGREARRASRVPQRFDRDSLPILLRHDVGARTRAMISQASPF